MKNSYLSDCNFEYPEQEYQGSIKDDIILYKLTQLMGIEKGNLVDLGAANGITGSNTYLFCHKLDWSGIQIDADPERFKKLNNLYKDNKKVHCVNEFVREGDLNTIAEKYNFYEIDILSIDVDGPDYTIWKAFKYQPKIVVIEYNKTMPHKINYNSDSGSSLLAFQELGKEKGYELVAANELNAFFVRKEYFNLCQIQSNSIDDIFPEHYKYNLHIFQDYEGNVIFQGFQPLVKKLLACEDVKRSESQSPPNKLWMNSLCRIIWGSEKKFTKTPTKNIFESISMGKFKIILDK